MVKITYFRWKHVGKPGNGERNSAHWRKNEKACLFTEKQGTRGMVEMIETNEKFECRFYRSEVWDKHKGSQST